MQTRVSGERSARKIPLKATILDDARGEMADIRKRIAAEGLPRTGLRPLFSDHVGPLPELSPDGYDSGKRRRAIAT